MHRSYNWQTSGVGDVQVQLVPVRPGDQPRRYSLCQGLLQAAGVIPRTFTTTKVDLSGADHGYALFDMGLSYGHGR